MAEVSFIMPIYNVENYLPQCIDSVLAQTFEDFELILVDDGSPDGSGAICDSYAEKDSRVNVIHKPNGGVSEARNSGIKVATGNWAYIIDSDDWLEKDALEKMYSAAMKNNADCVMSDVLVHYPNRQRRGYLFSQGFCTSDRVTIGAIQKFILCHKFSPYYTEKTIIGFAAPWSKLVRMSIIKDNDVYFDPYVKGRFDDGLWSLHMLDHANTVCYIPEVTYNYRMLAGSITHSFKPQALDILSRGFSRTEDWIKETNKDQSFLVAHYGRVCMFFAMQTFQYFFNEKNPKSHVERVRELKNTMKQEPYKTAIASMDLTKLEKKQKYVIQMARIRFVPGLELYAKLKIKRAEKD